MAVAVVSVREVVEDVAVEVVTVVVVRGGGTRIITGGWSISKVPRCSWAEVRHPVKPGTPELAPKLKAHELLSGSSQSITPLDIVRGAHAWVSILSDTLAPLTTMRSRCVWPSDTAVLLHSVRS